MKAGPLASACAVALASFATQVSAQSASGDQGRGDRKDADLVGEVIVTSTRRPEKLQDVPLSVTAFDQKEPSSKGIVGFEGLARQTPGVALNRATANFNNFTARSVATNGYGANLQSTVAAYIDEPPILMTGNTTVLDPNLFDVERVESLRGPQATPGSAQAGLGPAGPVRGRATRRSGPLSRLFDDHSVTYVHPEAFIASRFATMRPRRAGARLGYAF